MKQVVTALRKRRKNPARGQPKLSPILRLNQKIVLPQGIMNCLFEWGLDHNLFWAGNQHGHDDPSTSTICSTICRLRNLIRNLENKLLANRIHRRIALVVLHRSIAKVQAERISKPEVFDDLRKAFPRWENFGLVEQELADLNKRGKRYDNLIAGLQNSAGSIVLLPETITDPT